MNETTVRAIERGLGGIAADEGWLALGSLIEDVPAVRYDADEVRQLQARLGPSARGLEEDLEWTRGE